MVFWAQVCVLEKKIVWEQCSPRSYSILTYGMLTKELGLYLEGINCWITVLVNISKIERWYFKHIASEHVTGQQFYSNNTHERNTCTKMYTIHSLQHCFTFRKNPFMTEKDVVKCNNKLWAKKCMTVMYCRSSGQTCST